MSVKMCKLCPMYLYLYICILCKVLFYVFVYFICRIPFKTEICKESSFSLSALTTRLYDIDNKSNIDIIYLDFQKTFDTVPHQRLLKKWKGYGIQGKVLCWIESFLKNRKQNESKFMDPHQTGQMCPAGYHRELC